MKDEIRPTVAITMGDPTGIGPEITVKALTLEEIHGLCNPTVVGDADVVKSNCEQLGVSLSVKPVKMVEECEFDGNTINVLDMANVDLSLLEMGKVTEMGGRAAAEYIIKATKMALEGEADAITTGPIHKQALNLAGYTYSGHTEFLADLTKTKTYRMMLASPKLRVVHVTTHCALRQACDLIKRQRVLETIRLAHQAGLDLGFKTPVIGVSGLNPHAGEGGLFGHEEIEEIIPAIEEAKREGIDARGPYPPDSVFYRAIERNDFDLVIAMYHDQGHIPLKIVFFNVGVNVTLGLPIIRTSVDHGVAYGRAGEGRADPTSMIEAIKLASRMALARKGHKD